MLGRATLEDRRQLGRVDIAAGDNADDPSLTGRPASAAASASAPAPSATTRARSARKRTAPATSSSGKTVLLMEFDVLASEAGWATTDVQEVGSQPDFRLTFARMATRLLREMSRKHRLRDRVERALGVVKAFSIAVPGAIQLKLDVQAASGVADSGDPEQDLTELLLEIGEVAQASQSGALFLIDEMHNLDTHALAAICIAFQAISRRGLPVALVGAGLPDLQVRLIAAKPYADRLFQYRELGRLPEAAARAALVGPAATLGVEYEEKAAREVVRESAGYPYFIQEYGLELLHTGPGP